MGLDFILVLGSTNMPRLTALGRAGFSPLQCPQDLHHSPVGGMKGYDLFALTLDAKSEPRHSRLYELGNIKVFVLGC
jgi:hypothetical protein